MRLSSTLDFSRYQGLIFGVMIAAGSLKGGAILWQTTFNDWPLLYVLALPVGVAGVALGLGAAQSRLVTARMARRLPVVGVLLLMVPFGAGTHVGAMAAAQAWATVGTAALGCLALPFGHPDVRLLGHESADVTKDSLPQESDRTPAPAQKQR